MILFFLGEKFQPCATKKLGQQSSNGKKKKKKTRFFLHFLGQILHLEEVV
jgi:hypothetical protein